MKSQSHFRCHKALIMSNQETLMVSQTLVADKITVMTSQIQFGSHKAVIKSNQKMLMGIPDSDHEPQVNSNSIPDSVWVSQGSKTGATKGCQWHPQTLIGSYKITVITSQTQFESAMAIIWINQEMLMASQTLIGSYKITVMTSQIQFGSHKTQ